MNSPLRLLPGWCLGRGPLQATAEALGGIVLDLPGHNERALVTDFHQAADALADDLPPGTDLLGWSLGAMLALTIAARDPAKVRRLILVAGTASFVSRPGWPHAMAPEELAAFSAAALADIGATLPRFVANFSRGDQLGKAVVRAALASADPPPSKATLAAGLAWLRDNDLRPLLDSVTCPVLLLHGAADPLMPLAAAELLAAKLRDARLVALPGSAHTPFLSSPGVFLDEVRRFLG